MIVPTHFTAPVDDLDLADDVLHTALGVAGTTEIDFDQISLALDMRDAIMKMENDLRTSRSHLEQKIASCLPDDSVALPGIGVVRRRKNLGKHQLERGKEMLMKDVLDSVRVDKDTGELIDETEREKLEVFWDHSVHGVRAGAMKDRGLKWNDYAETVDLGWKLDVQREGGHA